MLDVHAPEHTPHSWRDFLIHIATIVVGLLIAVGIEQSVELLHHRTEVRETRRALAIERKLNLTIAVARTKEFARITPILKRNLAVFEYLSKHPGAPPGEWPGKLSWQRYQLGFDDAAWQTALKSNVVAYMPHNEVADLTELYGRMSSSNDEGLKFSTMLNDATLFAVREPDASKLSPPQIDHEIDLLAEALFQHAADGNILVNLKDHYPEYASPSRPEIAAIRHLTSPTEDVDAAHAIQAERDHSKADIQRENSE